MQFGSRQSITSNGCLVTSGCCWPRLLMKSGIWWKTPSSTGAIQRSDFHTRTEVSMTGITVDTTDKSAHKCSLYCSRI